MTLWTTSLLHAYGMWLLICTTFWYSSLVTGANEFCELDVFEPSCAEDEVILMKSAFYGRMALGRCITQDYGHIGCKVDVLPIMDGFCSGRQKCSVEPINAILVTAKTKGCPKDMSAYLVPEYSCLKVQKGSSSQCQSKGFISLSSESGYISVSSDDPQAGTNSCPFKVNVAPGRRVNFTMISFPPTPTIQNSAPSSACYEMGSIRERGKTKTIHKCVNDARSKNVHFTNGGPVEIVIPNKESLDVAGRFILHYQVSGCGDPTLPKNSDVQQENNKLIVKCKTGNQRWELICKDGDWTGETGQCYDEADGWSFLGLFDHEHPFGTAIVVGIGATLGVLIGGILLYIIIAIFKRCQKSDYVMTYDKSNLLLQDDKLFEQNSNTWGSQRHGNSNTLSRGGGTDHSRVPLPPLPNDNNTLSYEKPLYNRNGNV